MARLQTLLGLLLAVFILFSTIPSVRVRHIAHSTFSNPKPGSPLSDQEYEQFFEHLTPKLRAKALCKKRMAYGCDHPKIQDFDLKENHGIIPKGTVCTDFIFFHHFKSFCQFAKFRCSNKLYYAKRMPCKHPMGNNHQVTQAVSTTAREFVTSSFTSGDQITFTGPFESSKTLEVVSQPTDSSFGNSKMEQEFKSQVTEAPISKMATLNYQDSKADQVVQVSEMNVDVHKAKEADVSVAYRTSSESKPDETSTALSTVTAPPYADSTQGTSSDQESEYKLLPDLKNKIKMLVKSIFNMTGVSPGLRNPVNLKSYPMANEDIQETTEDISTTTVTTEIPKTEGSPKTIELNLSLNSLNDPEVNKSLCEALFSGACIPPAPLIQQWKKLDDEAHGFRDDDMVCDSLGRCHVKIFPLSDFCSLKIDQCNGHKDLQRVPCGNPNFELYISPDLPLRREQTNEIPVVKTRRFPGFSEFRGRHSSFWCSRLAMHGCQDFRVAKWLGAEYAAYHRGDLPQQVRRD
ncbi:hypothetical protein XENTR_v10017908 [Xenopus tropicalis]|nr:hypothetical protein XENTR_v10017908 [Xenopus tropicalis]